MTCRFQHLDRLSLPPNPPDARERLIHILEALGLVGRRSQHSALSASAEPLERI
ncbi:MAG: hypothetical protein HY360_08760 [Verrucomicrobia bacterium]|nr:hypothetical protein [Verrucomicrobiota bacterium]